eukprot:1106916-Prorocentrum_minimum.AAC.2
MTDSSRGTARGKLDVHVEVGAFLLRLPLRTSNDRPILVQHFFGLRVSTQRTSTTAEAVRCPQNQKALDDLEVEKEI